MEERGSGCGGGGEGEVGGVVAAVVAVEREEEVGC